MDEPRFGGWSDFKVFVFAAVVVVTMVMVIVVETVVVDMLVVVKKMNGIWSDDVGALLAVVFAVMLVETRKMKGKGSSDFSRWQQ